MDFKLTGPLKLVHRRLIQLVYVKNCILLLFFSVIELVTTQVMSFMIITVITISVLHCAKIELI